MKKTLITGSEGFVGQHLWKELKDNGYEVYGTSLDVPPSGLPENVYQCNILERENLSRLIADIRPDSIFHLAGQPKPALSFEKPQQTFEINTIGTINLLESVKRLAGYRPRIILVGSASEFGQVAENQLPITEVTPLNPDNPYAISKAACWFLARQYVASFGFNIVYSVSFNHTGPGQSLGFIAPDVASQIARIEKGLQEPVISTGDLSAVRDICDVRDVVRAYRLLADNGKSGERYIVSSGKGTQIQYLVDTLIGLSDTKIVLSIDQAKNRPSNTQVSYGSHIKITQETGWEPEISLEKTLADLLDSYRAKVK